LLHQSQAFSRRISPHTITELALHLPPGIHSAYYYDLIGNVSTSHLRVAPSPKKGAVSSQHSLLELKPRYPLLGGWNYSFTLGWDSPLADSARWDAKQGRYIVGVPVMTLFVGAVVEDADVKIILPEAST
jgi:oligosaccharyltransferase complex subunit alpha (ribophorin I)